MNKLKAILKDEGGQGMLEYVLLMGVIAVIIIAFKSKIGPIISNLTETVGTNATDALK